ncbi:MAG TPA: DUF6390 family protein [Thermomicrobiales bacterium]|jgi:hypothetical protein
MDETISATATTGIPTPARSLDGTNRFIRYAFMPNKLRYCGGDDNSEMFAYALAEVREPPLETILRKFSGAMPYLTLIARSNGIADPFDDRVVEAYWIGNELLDHVEVRDMYASLRERYSARLSPKLMALVANKAPEGARAHHSFHVFDAWRTAEDLSGDVLATLDNCRISWGAVQTVEGADVIVERRPIEMHDGKLAFGASRRDRMTRLIGGKGFVTTVAPGDIVSLHWGWVCDVLTPRQVANLARFTDHHLRLANRTI